MNNFAKNLTYCLNRFDVTQSQLGSYVDKGQTTVGSWCSGNTEPSIEILLSISNYFAISVDDLLREDLKISNLISDEHVKKFKANSILFGKESGNLMRRKKPIPYRDNSQISMVKDEDDTTTWATLKLLKNIDEKVDQLLKISKNKPH